MQKVTESAFAKVNLTLAVTGRRPDGYHTLETVFQSVSLCDLYLSVHDSVRIQCQIAHHTRQQPCKKIPYNIAPQ